MILWLDNDEFFLKAHLLAMQLAGYEVKQVSTLTEGEKEINERKIRLLILDVMMPVTASEETNYPPSETDKGHKAGLVFYRKHKETLEEKGREVLVFTIREDPEIREEFIESGLSPDNVMIKSKYADTSLFIRKIKTILGEGQLGEDG